MTVAESIRAATERLSATSDTARLDAEVLMAHALGLSRSDMLVRAMREAAPGGYDALVQRRICHEPIAYIIGKQEFYGRTFAVEAGILIPRGDSETLIEAALDLAPNASRLLDLGTGSGALLVTALLELENAHGIGIDASETAVRVAGRNAQSLGLTGAQARFLQRDWNKPGWGDDLGQFDLILCNPPYVEEAADLGPDVRDFEPSGALFSGPEGLDDYRAIFPQLGKLMTKNGLALLEIGATQAESVTEIAEESGFSVGMRRDLANRPRVLIFRT
ncbi:peptide chain release factor N(5)-glutamine methyltransferase [Erythrobacter sp. THAF29]|uniref:peptide chain release factor N(5)-glutamine methyltransferase n=1 Tax=Erythrobacter sp. THAF29 TaxID=2587851 RepID=UPI00126838A8|nr:peptide chain release factor N(5)-glutamine methyltransferase [Erythrobacter sp. THAF29]QFT76097.1 Release factor glutamine methyltransferase [Erythrobacter sp. THAF29]